MRTDFTDDDDIVFDHNDTPRELLRATKYIRRQLDFMVEAGALVERENVNDLSEPELSEAEHADEALTHLVQLESLLDERAGPSVDDVDWASMHDEMSGIGDMMGDIMSTLGPHDPVLSNQDWLGVNPHGTADETALIAADAEHAIDRHLDDDDDDDEAVCDGGIPDHALEDAVGLEWDGTPTHVDSNGQGYLVGWDAYGYYSLVRVDMEVVEDDWHNFAEDAEIVSFPPSVAQSVADDITNR